MNIFWEVILSLFQLRPGFNSGKKVMERNNETFKAK